MEVAMDPALPRDPGLRARDALSTHTAHPAQMPSSTGLEAGQVIGVPNGRFPRWIRVGFWLSIVISIAAVLLRAIALSEPLRAGGPPGTAELDAYFKAHAALTWTHILCAAGYVLLLPFCFWKRTRNSVAVQRMFFAAGFVVAATAYAMNLYAIGGWVERSAILFFNTLFVLELAKALRLHQHLDAPGAQLWSIRATATLLGIATTRPVVGIFFATSPLTHLAPQHFFGYAFWIGFSINVLLIELWLRSRGRAAERILS